MTPGRDLESVDWVDAEIDSISIDYDTIRVLVRLSSGEVVQLSCRGYILFGITGMWNEVQVADLSFRRDHPRVREAVDRLGPAARTTSGSPDRNAREFGLADMRLADGASIECVCATVEVSGLA